MPINLFGVCSIHVTFFLRQESPLSQTNNYVGISLS